MATHDVNVVPSMADRVYVLLRGGEIVARGTPKDVFGDPELDRLTPREREVLRLIARGYAYKEIALRLTISPKTVEAHVSAVLRKLQLSNRHELSHWAVERRLVD